MEKVRQLIKDFNLVIKQCYLIVWSVGRKQKVTAWWLQRQKQVKPILLSKCAACGSKTSRSIKD